MAGSVEFIDCGSLSVSYNVNGVASISFAIVKNSSESVLVSSYSDPSYGGVLFDGVVVRATQQPIIGSGGWNQWQIQVDAVSV